jgi:hypothetical protein
MQCDSHRRPGAILGIAIFVAKVVMLGIGWYSLLTVLDA